MGRGLRESEATKAALTFYLAVAKPLPLLDLSVDGATELQSAWDWSLEN